MKKLLLFCFLVSSGLMAMKEADPSFIEATTLASKIALTHDHFAIVDGNFELTEQAGNLLYKNFKDSSKKINKVRVKEVLNDIANYSFIGGFNTGLIEGQEKAFKSLYDSKPKIAAVGILTLIVVISTIYTGVSLFRKYKKWRGDDTE